MNKPHIEELLRTGADVNAAPMGKGHPTSLVWSLLSDFRFITAYPEATDFLLEHGADVNMKNPTLNSKHEPVLAYLVAHHGQKATPELVKFCSRLIEEYDVDLEAVDDEKKDVIWTCAETLETQFHALKREMWNEEVHESQEALHEKVKALHARRSPFRSGLPFE